MCNGAVINGAIAPLDCKLNNGDVVEIITSRSQKPSKDWLRFVTTNRAKIASAPTSNASNEPVR